MNTPSIPYPRGVIITPPEPYELTDAEKFRCDLIWFVLLFPVWCVLAAAFCASAQSWKDLLWM